MHFCKKKCWSYILILKIKILKLKKRNKVGTFQIKTVTKTTILSAKGVHKFCLPAVCRNESDHSAAAPLVEDKYTTTQQQEFNAMYNVIAYGKSKTAPSMKLLQNAIFGIAAEGYQMGAVLS